MVKVENQEFFLVNPVPEDGRPADHLVMQIYHPLLTLPSVEMVLVGKVLMEIPLPQVPVGAMEDMVHQGKVTVQPELFTEMITLPT